MRTAIDRTANLPCVITGIPRCSEYADLASVPIRLRAVKPAPMSLFAKGPSALLGVSHGRFDVFVGVMRSAHASEKIIIVLTFVNEDPLRRLARVV